MTANEIIVGLTQGEVTSIIIVALAAILILLLLSTVLRLGATLIRFGCLVVVAGVFLFAITRMLN